MGARIRSNGDTWPRATCRPRPTNRDCFGAPPYSLTIGPIFEKGKRKEQPSSVKLTVLVTPIHTRKSMHAPMLLLLFGCAVARVPRERGNLHHLHFTPTYRADITSWKIKTPHPVQFDLSPSDDNERTHTHILMDASNDKGPIPPGVS